MQLDILLMELDIFSSCLREHEDNLVIDALLCDTRTIIERIGIIHELRIVLDEILRDIDKELASLLIDAIRPPYSNPGFDDYNYDDIPF